MPRKKGTVARGKDRQDGAATRAGLLEAAGAIFAEHGFDRTTAKEIAMKAQTNAASVNYHFGGIEALYEEVLAEAHNRLISYEMLAAAVAASIEPEEQLRRLITVMVGIVRGDNKESWPVKVIVREMVAPTGYIDKLRREQLEPKKALLLTIISQILKVPPTAPIVAQAALSTIAPCFMLLIADARIADIMPPLGRDAISDQALADRVASFALAGIKALATATSSDATE